MIRWIRPAIHKKIRLAVRMNDSRYLLLVTDIATRKEQGTRESTQSIQIEYRYLSSQSNFLLQRQMPVCTRG